MSTVDDVAAAILRRTGPIDSFKLQKLLYYSQAWHAVWEGLSLFDEPIEAWANGPVCRAVYERHRGRFTVPDWPWGNPDSLGEDEQTTIDAVVRSYSRFSGRQLSVLTHSERPWLEARQGLTPTDRSDRVITLDSMVEYYGALDADPDSEEIDDRALAFLDD